MDQEQQFQELLQHIAPEPQELAQRLRFLGWQQADQPRLSAYAAQAEQATDEFIDHLYSELSDYPAPSAILRDNSTVERLKSRQAEYYHRLWQGSLSDSYVLERLRIGWVHQRLGVDLKWYLGAYRLYLEKVLQRVLQPSDATEGFNSLIKKVFFDIGLTIDSYNAAQRRALQESEARYARAMRGANDGLWEWQLEQDQMYVSERWVSMLGLNRDSLSPTSASWFSRVHSDDLPGLRQAIDTHLRGETAFLHHEYRIRQHDGRFIWVLVRGVAETNSSGQHRITGSQTDISERRAAQDQLHHAARHDPLTGLANRARLNELLQRAIEHNARRGAREAAVLFIDLDRFKLINDSLGHQVGDHVLIDVAKRLSLCLRPGDHLARFGGDEFVALLNDLACMQDAELVAQRMLESLRTPLTVAEQQLVISASIGIASLNEPQQSIDPLQAADMALYRAKTAGKAQYARYSAELQQQAQRQLELQSALAQANARNELRLVYQPICAIDRDEPSLVAVEALLRWRYQGQDISPLEFIPNLEESGGIIAVGEWVLRQACSQLRAWQLAGQPELKVSVNLSSRQLQELDFASRVADILRETGLSPTSLILEITESQLVQDSMHNPCCLRELASLGIQLALDDFGTGYSALGYLKRFPIHILKVDKSFISANLDGESQAISRAIIGLGQSLGLSVIAEGVEQPAQLSFLCKEGCQLAQGFWLSHPREVHELSPLLSGEERFSGAGQATTRCEIPA